MSERTGLNPLASQKIQTELKNAENQTNTTLPIIEAANKIEKLIYNDQLTGFENRKGLNRYKNSLKPEQYPQVIFTADLDNLKKINDNPDPEIGGHAGGDKYILSFVKFVNEIFPDNKKFRLGGDEFAIPIPNLDPKELEATYQKLEVFNEKDFYDALKRSDDKLVEAKKIKKSK
jgi:GGDEF domain-containing protein